VGAATIAQVRLFNTHPTGQALKRERLAALMGDAAYRNAATRRTAWKYAPKIFLSPRLFPKLAAK